jgi:hypothetical protein
MRTFEVKVLDPESSSSFYDIYEDVIIILLMDNKEKEPQPTMRAQRWLVVSNVCKCTRDKLSMPSKARRSLRQYIFGHPSYDRPLRTLLNFHERNDGGFGVMVGILAYYARGRGFDSCTVQTFLRMNMPVYWVWVFLYIICIYYKKIYKYAFIRYLESIPQALKCLIWTR